MRLLSITAQKPDSTGSGIYLTELVRGFDKMGIEQAVIAGITEEDSMNFPEQVQVFPVYFETAELPFHIVGMSDEMPYASTKYSNMTEEMTGRFVSAFKSRIEEVLTKFQPDIILCHHLYFLTALVCEVCKKDSKIRVYGVSHGSDLRQIKKNPWQREYVVKWIPKLDGIFALHEEQKIEICQFYGCEKDNVRVIGTGYNSDVFFIEETAKKDKSELSLIFAGKISEKKGVKSLIRAMDYLGKDECRRKQIHLTLVGGAGNEKEYREICALAEKSLSRIEFTGKMPQQELARRLNQSDIFILPSFFEGLPLVVVEAMACGLRVVCTDLPGVKSWLDANIPGNGVVFVTPPEMINEDEPVEETLPEFEKNLAEAILEAELAEVPQRRDVECISWDGLCERFIDVFYNKKHT